MKRTPVTRSTAGRRRERGAAEALPGGPGGPTREKVRLVLACTRPARGPSTRPPSDSDLLGLIHGTLLVPRLQQILRWLLHSPVHYHRWIALVVGGAIPVGTPPP